MELLSQTGRTYPTSHIRQFWSLYLESAEIFSTI
jgi:hypothetical protein